MVDISPSGASTFKIALKTTFENNNSQHCFQLDESQKTRGHATGMIITSRETTKDKRQQVCLSEVGRDENPVDAFRIKMTNALELRKLWIETQGPAAAYLNPLIMLMYVCTYVCV